MTTPENPEQPDAKTEHDQVEKKSVATEEAPASPEQPAAPAEPATNGAVSHEQETAKFSAGDAAAAEPAAAAPPAAAPSAPPPWQRVTADTAAAAGTIASTAYESEPVDTSSQATTNFRPVTPPAPAASPLDSPTVSTRTSVNLGGTTATPPRGTAAPTALRRPGRGPRRASLQIKRVDPWSVLKLALVLGFAMFLVWMVAVGVLYSVLGGMNVWTKLNGTYNDLVQGGDNSGGDLISAGRVFGVAAVVGLVNVILFTAMATVSAFIYNVCADLAGGVEVTLSERE